MVASRAWAAFNVLESSGFVEVAPLWGLFESPLLSRAVRLDVGSFDGPYNIRLHLTVPREHLSRAARGERVWRVGQPHGSARHARSWCSLSFTAG
jgi:hypothetical protein